MAPFKEFIDEMLRSDLDAPKKQRHTARRILARLVDEHHASDLSYSTARDHVHKRIEEVDFAANASVNPAIIHQFATCAWVKAGHPLCLIGTAAPASRTC